ncbi:hypothetical protein T07_5169 [Trichinella nelsoni]|uniref:Uncharacterized protein n=1 Tax=Trichinella nelsoni TaxID=6336 RepID=A0A0V0RSQ1_9BILA|nr:hypothetical protein T07_5169 [Trichinella nelsoni]
MDLNLIFNKSFCILYLVMVVQCIPNLCVVTEFDILYAIEICLENKFFLNHFPLLKWFVSYCATICRADSVCESKFFVNTERIMMKSPESAESGNRRTIFTIGITAALWGSWKLLSIEMNVAKFMEITFVNYFSIIGKCISKKKDPMPWELNFELHCSDGSGFMVPFTRNIKDLVECHFQISGCVGQSEKFIDFSASLQKLIYLSFLIFLLFEMGKVRDSREMLY